MAEPSAYQKAYLDTFKRRKRLVTFLQIFICILFFVLWEVSTRLGLLNDFIFSSPGRIIKTFTAMASDGTIFYHIGITLFETFLSFFIVLAAGILLSVLLWWNKSIEAVLEPYLITLNSLPKTCLLYTSNNAGNDQTCFTKSFLLFICLFFAEEITHFSDTL